MILAQSVCVFYNHFYANLSKSICPSYSTPQICIPNSENNAAQTDEVQIAFPMAQKAQYAHRN